MPCTTCSQPLARLSVDATKAVYYCSRCGTVAIVQHGTGLVTPIAPELVSRCRALVKDAVRDRHDHPGAGPLLKTLEALGVIEAIYRVEDRPV